MLSSIPTPASFETLEFPQGIPTPISGTHSENSLSVGVRRAVAGEAKGWL